MRFGTKRYGKRLTSFKSFLLVLCSTMFVSCLDVPQPTIVATSDQTVEPVNLVGVDGRENYDWNLTDRGFELTRDSRVRFVNEFEKGIECKRLFPEYAPNASWTRPKWMSDEAYEEFRRFVESPRSA